MEEGYIIDLRHTCSHIHAQESLCESEITVHMTISYQQIVTVTQCDHKHFQDCDPIFKIHDPIARQ